MKAKHISKPMDQIAKSKQVYRGPSVNHSNAVRAAGDQCPDSIFSKAKYQTNKSIC